MEINTVDHFPTEKKSGTPWWVWVLVGILACCCLGTVATVAALSYLGGEPENVSVDYSMPPVVQNGEAFDLVIRVTNIGGEPVTISDIDLDEALGGSILDGSVVLETEPFMERDYSVSGIKSFAYNRTIQPGETATITFHLQATQPGEFGGSVGLYIGNLAKRIEYLGLIVQE